MSKKLFIKTFIIIIFICGLSNFASASTYLPDAIGGRNIILGPEGSPYIVDHLTILPGSIVRISAGTVFKFVNSSSFIDIQGILLINANADNPAYFTSIKDDTVGGDTNEDGNTTTPSVGDWGAVLVSGSIGDGHLNGVNIRYAGAPIDGISAGIINKGFKFGLSGGSISNSGYYGVYQSETSSTSESGLSGASSVVDSTISGHSIGIGVFHGEFYVSNTILSNNTEYGVYNDSSTNQVTSENNDWGDPSGPYHPILNPGGIGSRVSDYIDFEPWISTPPNESCTPGTEGCNSSVLFFPGFEGTRLYELGDTGSVYCGPGITGDDCKHDEELWLSRSSENHERLSLNTNGESMNEIYTFNDTQKLEGDGDELGILDDAYSVNIYQSFLHDLKDWKNENLIEDYAFIPYDWRLSLNDVITNGHLDTLGHLSYEDNAQSFSNSFILQKLQSLQESSRTGKVTIVAHSNGGLVAKALVQKLKDGNNPLYEKIDKIILVATPQIGTPEGLVALLHGIDLGPLGMIMSTERTRQLAENMPGVYNLLPSASYFTTFEPQYATDKIISFPDEPFFEPQTSQYGLFVSNATELENFVLGTDGRTKPTYYDTDNPNIGNGNLYNQAKSVHEILDTWTPHPDTKVIQVAGWGEETLAGIKYKEIFTLNCPPGVYSGLGCVPGTKMSFNKREVVDGDATVVVPSALWMSETNPNVERWYVDLFRLNSSNTPILGVDREHKDILEVPNLRNFIKAQVQNIGFVDSESIILDSNANLVSNENRLHFALHSPLTLGITDTTTGKYTGLDPLTGEVKNEIPDVNYEQIGEVQFLSVPAGVPYTLVMQGYEQGSFALDVEKQVGNDVLGVTSFQGIPSGIDTIATMDIPIDFRVDTSELKIDNNGDNIVDKTLDATPDGVTVYDTTAPEISITFNQVTKEVGYSAIDDLPTTFTHSNISITAKDTQNNTSILNFTKFKEKPTRLKFSFNTIKRNEVNTAFPNTNVLYDWQLDKNNNLTDLDTKVMIKGVEKYIFNYKKKENITIIKTKVGNTTTTTTKQGFVSVTIKTEKDEVKVNY